MIRQPRIIIVGAGIVGLATAYALLNQGMQHVVVLEQESVAHRRGTSAGPSRLLRFEYGADAFYSRMVQLSFNRWQNLQLMARRTLYTPTGVLLLGSEDDGYTKASYSVLREMGLPTERLCEQVCRQRFPQFATRSCDIVTYNTEAAILHASTCLHTLRDLITDLGGQIYESCCVTRLAHEQQYRPVHLHLQSGEELTADRVVVAVGPWVHHLLSDLCLPVELTRQYLLYFAGLPTSQFGIHHFPAFIAQDLYGFPILHTATGHGSGWLKAASHSFGLPIDPDEVPSIDEFIIARAARRLRELLPALQQATLAHVDSCMYDVTPDQDFILDYVPDDSRVVYATGLTGHGFKFGLLLGELLSSLVREASPPVPIERFRLARFAHRAVHAAASSVA